jgi:hypothetical protein
VDELKSLGQGIPGGTDLPVDHWGERRLSRPRAVACLLIGVLLFLLSFLGVFLATAAFLRPGGGVRGAAAEAAIFVIAMALFYPGARLLMRAKRHRAASARRLLSRDPRPPVVYFRPFTADAIAGRGVIFSSWVTEEEQLGQVMTEIGPFVAVGAPRESLPELGAARLYVADSEWHQAVENLLERARLVVLRVGRSPGFWWELETSLRARQPEQLLLLVPRDEQLYEDFRRRARELMPCDMPRLTGWNYRRWWRGSLKAAVFFDADWVPNIVDVQTFSLSFLRRSPAFPLVPVMHMALRPMFEHLAVPWKRPPINRRLVLVLTTCLLYAVFLAAMSHDWSPSRSGAPFVEVAPAHPSTPAEAEQRFGEQLMAISGIRRGVEQLLSSPQLATVSPEERHRLTSAAVKELVRSHTRAGLRRLADADLLARLELDRKLLAVAAPGACAAFARGSLGAEPARALVRQLEVPEIEQYFDILVRAVKADMEGAPVARSVDPETTGRSFESIVAGLPAEKSVRMRRILSHYNQASADEVCWSERTLRAAIAGLAERERVQWALSIFQ